MPLIDSSLKKPPGNWHSQVKDTHLLKCTHMDLRAPYNSEPKENGSAEINIKLTNGIISVNHTDINFELASWVGSKGDWNKIWSLIDSLVKKNNDDFPEYKTKDYFE